MHDFNYTKNEIGETIRVVLLVPLQKNYDSPLLCLDIIDENQYGFELRIILPILYAEELVILV